MVNTFVFSTVVYLRERRVKHLIQTINKTQKQTAKIQERVVDQQSNLTIQVAAVLDTLARTTQSVFDIMKEVKHDYNRGKTK